MVLSSTVVLARFKADWAAQLQPDAIKAACQEAGYTTWRDRLLTPVTTLQLFLLQVLHEHRVQPRAPSVGHTVQHVGLSSSPYETPPRPL